MHQHHYQVGVVWTGFSEVPPRARMGYSRHHDVVIEGKPVIHGSSDPALGGDAGRHNPEELLVAALSQCHMLWYLNLCHAKGMRVLEYSDRASGTMEDDPRTGVGQFTEVTLRPNVLLAAGEENHELAHSLHEESGRRCYIANSVNFPVGHEPTVRFAGASAAA